MKWLIAPLTALLALLLTEPLPTAHAQSAKAAQNFVPGELIVGYKSEQDRDSALNDIRSDEGKLRGPGGSGVQAEEFGETGLKLSFDFSGITRGPNENSPSDLALLQGIAKSLRESDNRVKYAHPNWILNIDPPHINSAKKPETELQSFPEASEQQSPTMRLPNDPLFKLQWNYLAPPTGMNAISAWDQMARSDVVLGKPIVVTVLDTGIIYDHEDIAASGKVARGYSFVSRNLCTKEIVRRGPDATDTGNVCPSNNTSSDWHGTHVAGIIGAIGNNGRGIAGITWPTNVKILPVRVLGPNGGSVFDIADGIRWAAGLPVKGAPANTTPADVINMSFGGRITCDQENDGALISAILEARAAGTVIVATAGNGADLDDQGEVCSSGDTCRHVQEDFHKYDPAGCPGVISVAASDPYGHLAWYSNYGNVTIMAPGGDTRIEYQYQFGEQKKTLPLGIWSTIKGGYGPMQGTSQAAPHVSAAIALALSFHPDWVGKPDLIEQKLRITARKALPEAYPQDTPVGAGQLDARALVAAH